MEQFIYLILAVLAGIFGVKYFGSPKKNPQFEKEDTRLKEEEEAIKHKLDKVEEEKKKLEEDGVTDLNKDEVIDYWRNN